MSSWWSGFGKWGSSNDAIQKYVYGVWEYLSSRYDYKPPKPEPEPVHPTIAEIVQQSGDGFDNNSGDFDILLRALSDAGLVGAVAAEDADLTVFAPTDAAFIKLAQDLGADVQDGDEEGAYTAIVEALTALSGEAQDPIPLLQTILQYHVSPGAKSAQEIKHAETIETLAGVDIDPNGRELIDQDPDIENPELIKGSTDIKASNGVIQAIDRVLLPIDVPPPPKPTITDIVAESGGEFDHNSGDFDILLNAVQAAGLGEALATIQDLTVFAPTDAAFIKLAQDLGADISDKDEEGAFNAIVDALTTLSGEAEDPIPLLTTILEYHVSPGAKTASEIKHADTVETLAGVDITPNGRELIDQDPDIANPELIKGATDIHAENGIIQAIDRVLLPIDVPGPDDGKFVFEAEDLHLNGYKVEHDRDASGDALIKLTGHTGTASTVFDGESGKYALELTFADESDGQGSIGIYVDDAFAFEVALDKDLPGQVATKDNLISVVEEIELLSGQTITLKGTRDAHEFARIDKFALSPAEDGAVLSSTDSGDLFS